MADRPLGNSIGALLGLLTFLRLPFLNFTNRKVAACLPVRNLYIRKGVRVVASMYFGTDSQSGRLSVDVPKK